MAIDEVLDAPDVVDEEVVEFDDDFEYKEYHSLPRGTLKYPPQISSAFPGQGVLH